MYREIKRINNHGSVYIPKLKKVFPEIKHLDDYELSARFRELNLIFYSEEIKPVNGWIRLTLPFAIILFLLMIVFTPVYFLITGKWSYELTNKSVVRNWFAKLRILDNH
jgi:hypothetical protein